RLPGAQGIAGRGPDASHDRRVGRHSDDGGRPRAAARRACAGPEEPQPGGADRRFATRGPLVTSLMLSGEELDALQELVNFGMGAAGGPDVRAFLARDPVALSQGLLVDVDFKLEARAFFSRVLVFLPEHSILRLDQAITQLLDGLAAS